ncbi:NAD(P)/FAD-dependent oxidoreductase [Bacillus solimangrovi]|uniref:FAD/NAD(P)-binding domain-containing protein n=1 Tax=Bacillus solimangrovi TaxID=1305675 RepID=A0A1E5LDQ4_9BACI|nr:FAD-dependent oxidoreductase [Bacillus solimangrovi]OEH92221.1 hypothetical protein BFG57_02830 [Bacillus solimangrovi]
MKRLILAGCGHAHVYLLKQFANSNVDDVEILVFSPSRYQYYSGMFSGYAEAIYKLEDIRIDIEQMATSAGATLINEAVDKIDAHNKSITTANGLNYHFDILSINTGSIINDHHIANIEQYAHFIKPNNHYQQSVQALQTATQPVVVGGGASGIELSISLASYRNQHKLDQTPVSLIYPEEHVLKQFHNESLSKRVETELSRIGVQLIPNTRIHSVKENMLQSTNNEHITYSELLWLAGIRAPSLFNKSNLPTNTDGFLLVNKQLCVPEYPYIFGAGDSVTMKEHPNLPKAGVYAIRQAPLLWKNVIKALRDDSSQLEVFNPQKNYLAILSLSNHYGVAIYGKHYMFGKFAWKWKNYIDTKFMNQYK